MRGTSARSTAVERGRPHDSGSVEPRGAGFVLHCECGWTSPLTRTAEAVGDAWDRHRRAEAAGQS